MIEVVRVGPRAIALSGSAPFTTPAAIAPLARSDTMSGFDDVQVTTAPGAAVTVVGNVTLPRTSVAWGIAISASAGSRASSQ